MLDGLSCVKFYYGVRHLTQASCLWGQSHVQTGCAFKRQSCICQLSTNLDRKGSPARKSRVGRQGGLCLFATLVKVRTAKVHTHTQWAWAVFLIHLPCHPATPQKSASVRGLQPTLPLHHLHTTTNHKGSNSSTSFPSSRTYQPVFKACIHNPLPGSSSEVTAYPSTVKSPSCTIVVAARKCLSKL